MPAKGYTKSGSWTKEEDALLALWQSKIGNRWAEVAKQITGRSGQQCAQRWRHKVNPNIRKEKWTEEEDDLLVALFCRHGNAWAEISRSMDGRTDQQCMGRWKRHLDPAINRDAWKAAEDEELAALVEIHGNQWSSIAKHIPGRTSQQCRARWFQKEAGQPPPPQRKPPPPAPKASRKPKAAKWSDDEADDSGDDGTDFESETLIKARERRRSTRLPPVAEAYSQESESDHTSEELEENEENEISPPGCLTTPLKKAFNRAVNHSRSSQGGDSLSRRRSGVSLTRRSSGSDRQTSVRKKSVVPALSNPLRRASRGVPQPSPLGQGEDDPDFTPVSGLHPPRRPRSQKVRRDAEPDENSWAGHVTGNARLLALADEAGGAVSDGGVSHAQGGAGFPYGGEGFVGREACNDDRSGGVGGVWGEVKEEEQMDSGWMAGGGDWRQGTEAVGAVHGWMPIFKPSQGCEAQQAGNAVADGADGDLLSPPLMSQLTRTSFRSSDAAQLNLLAADADTICSPDKSLFSPIPSYLAERTPQHSSRMTGGRSRSRLGGSTPLTGSKRGTPGGGFGGAEDDWGASPDAVLHLFQSPNQGQPNPLQSPSFQSLATPEWAKKDWLSPPDTAARQGATPAGEGEAGELPSAGKPLARGGSGRSSVARRLNIEPLESRRITGGSPMRDDGQEGLAGKPNTPRSYLSSPAKRLRGFQTEPHPSSPSARSQTVAKPHLTDKENSACNALKQLSMVAFAMEHGGHADDSGSDQTAFPEGLEKGIGGAGHHPPGTREAGKPGSARKPSLAARDHSTGPAQSKDSLPVPMRLSSVLEGI